MFFLIILILLILSIVLAAFSLRKVLDKKEIDEVKKELSKGRVIFKKDPGSD